MSVGSASEEEMFSQREREVCLCCNQQHPHPFFCYLFLCHTFLTLENAQACISPPLHLPKHSAGLLMSPGPGLAVDSTHSLGCVLPEPWLFTQNHLINKILNILWMLLVFNHSLNRFHIKKFRNWLFWSRWRYR